MSSAKDVLTATPAELAELLDWIDPALRSRRESDEHFGRQPAKSWEKLTAALVELSRLRAEVERLAGSLAACGVIARCDDDESFHRWKIASDNPYWTDSLAAVTQLRESATSLRAERDGLREDAERYRWLRRSNSYSPFVAMRGPGGISQLTDDTADAYVDAALAATAEGATHNHGISEMTETKWDTFIAKLTTLLFDAAALGLGETNHAIHEVVRKACFERAYQLERREKRNHAALASTTATGEG